MAQVAEEHEFRVNEKQEKPDIFYLLEIFVGSLFPHTQIESNIWVADRPLHTLRISSPYGVPYGTLPRLLLAYIINTPSALAFLGNSRRRFKNILGSEMTDREFDRQIRNLFFHTLIDIEVVWGGTSVVGTDSRLLIIGARDPSWRNYQDLKSTSPYNQDSPTCILQRSDILGIPFHISVNLVSPKFTICFGNLTFRTAKMPVPETSVNKYHSTVLF